MTAACHRDVLIPARTRTLAYQPGGCGLTASSLHADHGSTHLSAAEIIGQLVAAVTARRTTSASHHVVLSELASRAHFENAPAMSVMRDDLGLVWRTSACALPLPSVPISDRLAKRATCAVVSLQLRMTRFAPTRAAQQKIRSPTDARARATQTQEARIDYVRIHMMKGVNDSPSTRGSSQADSSTPFEG